MNLASLPYGIYTGWAFSALVNIWQTEQRLVEYIAMAQSAKINPGFTPTLQGFVKTTPCQHEHMYIPHPSHITHRDPF